MRVTIEKKTDQLNYEDFLGGGTLTVTIAGVKKGTKEQQYDIEIEGDQRVWRPAVTVLKLLVEAWGDDATVWVGRRATLYGDPEVKFGREKVGGIRVSHLSHIDKALHVSLTETRGKRAMHHIEPLAEAARPAEPTPEDVIAAGTEADLKELWKRTAGGSPIRPLIRERVDALRTKPTEPPADPEQLSDEAFTAAAEGEGRDA